jgi:hypothetical protein
LKIWDVMRSTDFAYSDNPHGYLREFIGLPNAAKLARYARLLRSGSPPLRVSGHAHDAKRWLFATVTTGSPPRGLRAGCASRLR